MVDNVTGTLNYRDEEALARHTNLGKVRYKDFNAGYCKACQEVYGVECPKCGNKSGDHGYQLNGAFTVERPLETFRADGRNWTKTECAKCSFVFSVMVS